jgi:FkbM family methyltransferase
MIKKIKLFLKTFEFVKILIGYKNTFQTLKIINKKKFTGTSEFTVQNKNYKIKTNSFDLRSYQIHKGRQNHKIIFLKKFLKKGYFFDVGANYGEFAIVLNSRHFKTFCFEPNVFVFNCLFQTFKNYKNVFIYNLGVSDKNEKRQLSTRILNSGNSSFNISKKIKTFYSLSDYANSVILPSNANLIKLSKFLESININKNFFINIKIDIEGFEYKVLNDLLKYSSIINRKLFIMFENNQNSRPYKNELSKILLKFERLGFKFIILPSSKEDYASLKEDYTSLKDINLDENSEVCITNYTIF